MQVGAGDDYSVDVGRGLACALQCLFGSGNAHLAEDRPFVIGTLRQAWLHALRVEDAILVHDETAFDAAGFFDESRAGFGQRLDFSRFDGSGILRVELRDVGVERMHQLIV